MERCHSTRSLSSFPIIQGRDQPAFKSSLIRLKLDCQWYISVDCVQWIGFLIRILDYSIDHHDDTPIVQKLIILIKDPHLASKVRTVTHLCHIPGPDMFDELMTASFISHSLSSDWRTIELLRLAIRNLVNVHTLRLYFPHYNLGRVLLNDFFATSRPRNSPIRKLWLENCDIFCDNLYSDTFNMVGLESIRVRRLKSFYHPLGYYEDAIHLSFARDGFYLDKLDGAGRSIHTWYHSPHNERSTCPKLDGRSDIFKAVPTRDVTPCTSPGSVIFDRYMYQNIPEVDIILESRKELVKSLPPLNVDVRPIQRLGDAPSTRVFTYESNDIHLTRMLTLPWESLKHLNLDWILVPVMNHQHPIPQRQYILIAQLSALKFRNLTSFQFRNAVSSECHLPDRISLLHPLEINGDWTAQDGSKAPELNIKIDLLTFLENHPNLTCLAWPMDLFYPSVVESQYMKRIDNVVENLANNLETLRVDVKFDVRGERQVGDIRTGTGKQFIRLFASRMRVVKTIKMEVRR
jgi:hypothetical protein